MSRFRFAASTPSPIHPAVFDTAIEANQNYADFDAVLMEGVGHYLMLEKPEEFQPAPGRND